ncbi:MFS transporter [Sinomonas sp. P47F7]|uniref:MFS transporter n=1 Tax=Sinomonas sp. P47F7 TaxID=3410987 RepID=UPI003BF4C75E
MSPNEPAHVAPEEQLAAVASITTAQPAEPVGAQTDPLESSTVFGEPTTKVSKAYIFWMILANFGASLAYIVPLAFSLSIRVNQLAPGHQEVLGYVAGTAQLLYVLSSPLIGVWSDRFRSRLGRRRPFVIGGALLGLAALLVMALAPNVVVLALGWALAILGFGTVQAAIGNLQADRLPEEQRGKVSGLTGLSGQIAPILGVTIASAFVGNALLLFLIPGVIGAFLVLPFIFRAKEPDSRRLELPADRLSAKSVLASYVFDPRKAPDFAWNWLGRFVFFLGLYANTTFSAFFYSQRLSTPVEKVGQLVAVIGLIGLVAAMLGSIGAGFLSDRFRRRKLFTMIGVSLFTVGAIVEAFAYSLPVLVAGSLLMNLAIAAFSAVDQAIVIAVLPNRAEAGRYMAVVAFAQKIPSGIAPLLAPLVIGIGSIGGEKNYTLLYLIGGALAFIGGLIILTRVKSVR